MERYRKELAQLLPANEHLEISLNQDAEVIPAECPFSVPSSVTFSDNVMIHGDTAANIYKYCELNHLRCYITWDYVKRQICLGILKDTY